MDQKTKEALKLFDSHSRIKNLITFMCYIFILGGISVYVFHALNQNNAIKLVKKVKSDLKSYKIEKTMTNPQIKFKYTDGQIYNIQAKKAFHKDNQEVTLEDVFAKGDIGNITSGSLEISEEGNRLIFTNNPILILNKLDK